MAEAIGLPLMPWQEMVADVGGELLDDGTPAYREVVFTPPRQSGKTTQVLVEEIHRATWWSAHLGKPQRILYSAQSGSDARTKLLTDQIPILERHRHELGISKILRANGHEQIAWRNGSQLALLSSSADAGHGQTVDCGVKDELFADTDMRRDQALIPAMATRPFAQMFTCSTAGTPDSVAWNAKVLQGRAAVESGRDTGIAYFEWSAPLDCDPADPAVWMACMPALGRTQSLSVIEQAYDTMELGEFKRAFLNIPTLSSEMVIPQALWDAVCSNTVEAVAEVFAIDVDPDRTHAGIVAAGSGPVVEVIDYREGVGWLVARCLELWDKYKARFVVDRGGPAGSFGVELEAAGVDVVWVSTSELTMACNKFYDRVVNQAVQIRSFAALSRAVAGAVKRTVGDSWAWGRKSSKVDVCLLVAASLALWEVDKDPPSTPVFAY